MGSQPKRRGRPRKEPEKAPLIEGREIDTGLFKLQGLHYRLGAPGFSDAERKAAHARFGEFLAPDQFAQQEADIASGEWLKKLEVWARERKEAFEAKGKLKRLERIALHHASKVLERIHRVQIEQKNGDMAHALWWAYWLGDAAMSLEMFTRDNPRLESLKGAQVSHEKRYGTPKEKKARWQKHHETYLAVSREFPRDKQAFWFDEAAKRLGWIKGVTGKGDEGEFNSPGSIRRTIESGRWK